VVQVVRLSCFRDGVEQVGDVVDQGLDRQAPGSGPVLDGLAPPLQDGVAVPAQELGELRGREVGGPGGGRVRCRVILSARRGIRR